MRSILYTFMLALLLGCESDTTLSPSDSPESIFDANVEPTTSGSWYRPPIDVSWQWQLTNSVNTSYDVQIYDIDLFDSDISLIKSLQDDGKKVICYFSAGSYEEWREDAADFSSSLLGNTLDGWEDERWLDISNEDIVPLMRARLDLAVQKGCDGVEPDNLDGYINNCGFALSADNQLAYNKFIANEARSRGLSVALKNDVEQAMELEPYFDFTINEQCHVYEECEMLQPFTDANKPILNAEYKQKYVDNTENARDEMCQNSINLQLRTLILPLNLDDSFRISCD